MARTADRFWAELRALYQAAGQPTLKRLVRLGLEQHPPISISDSTINGWLNRKAVPTGRKNERYLAVLVAFLQGRTGPGDPFQPLPQGEWSRLLRAAQAERAAGRQQGRPRRTIGPARRADEIEGGSAADAGVIAGPGPEALFGRDRELAVLAGLVTGLAAGRGNAALIEGEPALAMNWGRRCRSTRCSMACTCASRPQIRGGTRSSGSCVARSPRTTERMG